MSGNRNKKQLTLFSSEGNTYRYTHTCAQMKFDFQSNTLRYSLEIRRHIIYTCVPRVEFNKLNMYIF